VPSADVRGILHPSKYDAVLFDLDGVLTATAHLHAAAWKRMFDEFLRQHATDNGLPFKEFDLDEDYKLYVDGKPRYEGVQSFLASRSIDLPYGEAGAAPTVNTIRSLGDRKNELINQVIVSEGVEAFPGSVALVRRLREAGMKTAVVTSSHNGVTVLEAAGIVDLFDVRVDGGVAARLKLAGKPQPDTFLKAAEQLGVEVKRAVVVEDAISGVQAGRAGRFGLVIGVDRKGDAEALRSNGADIVVKDLSELLPAGQ
jgi:beta-phosphoglucomutase family hydrolase